MVPKPDPDADPYPDAPDFPEDAEWFVFEGTSPSPRLDDIADRLGEDADEDDAREALPPWAEIETGVMTSSDRAEFPPGSPLLPAAVDRSQWRLRASQGQVVPLDADGNRLPRFEDDPLVEDARGYLYGLESWPDDGDADEDADSADDDAADDDHRDDPLAGLSVPDIRSADYSELRGLASATDGVDGNASRQEIETALVTRLRERSAGAPGQGGQA